MEHCYHVSWTEENGGRNFTVQILDDQHIPPEVSATDIARYMTARELEIDPEKLSANCQGRVYELEEKLPVDQGVAE